MPLKKSILFIDGSNFYHSLKQNRFLDVFSYKSFFEELNKGYDIQTVYYYDAIKNSQLEPEQYSKQQSFHERLRKDIPKLIIRSRKLKYIFNNERVENAKKNYSFCKTCNSKLDQFLKSAGLAKVSKEKGIDILLVTDLIKGAFQERYQVALLATGDADYVPAVELVQTLKKEVINMHFYAGSSSELRSTCNSHKLISIDAKGVCNFNI